MRDAAGKEEVKETRPTLLLSDRTKSQPERKKKE
jgi:hypothetical protein